MYALMTNMMAAVRRRAGGSLHSVEAWNSNVVYSNLLSFPKAPNLNVGANE
jgi:hypothetical protein